MYTHSYARRRRRKRARGDFLDRCSLDFHRPIATHTHTTHSYRRTICGGESRQPVKGVPVLLKSSRSHGYGCISYGHALCSQYHALFLQTRFLIRLTRVLIFDVLCTNFNLCPVLRSYDDQC